MHKYFFHSDPRKQPMQVHRLCKQRSNQHRYSIPDSVAKPKQYFITDTGLVDLAQEVKKYVKSVKNITLTEFRQISGLKFTPPRKQK